MLRKIICINEEKCNGCGLCANACHEGAIGIVDGKAKLLREDYCDGLGDCLPACPTGAITFEKREAPAYNEKAVLESKQNQKQKEEGARPCACPGSQWKSLAPQSSEETSNERIQAPVSYLRQWPVQIQLAPVKAPYWHNAKLLVAADCSAYTYGRFHEDFMKGKLTLIGCPKLDDVDYSQKLTEILKSNEIQSVTIVRMEVPCCGGLEQAVKTALQNSGKMIPWQVVTLTTEGRILE